MNDVAALLDPIRRIHDAVRDTVVAACEQTSPESMAGVAEEDESGDTVYAVDRVSEEALVALFGGLAAEAPLVLIAEGLHGGALVLPAGAKAADARWRVIVDPIDGTRGLMYQKRSAWILTGVAENRGPATNLADIALAVQTEIPLLKQHLSDCAWALRGSGAAAERVNRLTGARTPLALRPSQARTIAHGYAMVSRFFPGARDELAAIDEEIVFGALGAANPGKAHCFEDQYISSGGQLYELMAGHDRFVADLRPLLGPLLAARGRPLGICCRPYDLCTELIAREVGVVVATPSGAALDAPLDTTSDVAWAGYANTAIHDQVAPLLQRALARRGLA